MYTFWLKNYNNNTLKSRLNVWYTHDIRSFNILASSNLSYLLSTLNKPKLNTIKTTRSVKNFDYFIYFSIYMLVIFIFILKLFY